MENILADSGLHQCYTSDHTKNISNIMSSPLLTTFSHVMESIDSNVMNVQILNLLSADDTHFASLDLSSERDMTSTYFLR